MLSCMCEGGKFMHTVYFDSVGLNIGLTLTIIIALFFIFYFERLLIKKNEDKLKKSIIVVIYLVSLLLMAISIIGILAIWNVPMISYFVDSYDQIIALIRDEILRIINTFLVIFFAQVLLTISKITLKNIGIKPSPNQKRKRTIARVIRSITKYTIKIVAVLIILSIWGVNIAPALAGLGILGLVIGLGAQRFINDLISGFFIIFEHQFDVGDKIEVKGFKGEVIDIGLKTTKLQNWKGEIMILSNGEISSFINFSKNPSVAIVEFGIAYKENMKEVIDLITKELLPLRLAFPEIIEDPKVLGVIALDQSSVNIRAIAKTLNEQHYGVERAMRQKIKEILDEHGIEIPFPQVVVHNNSKK
jgi:moderate conductance mechanosensitive channel